VIIENPRSPLDSASDFTLLPPELDHSRRISWDSFVPEDLYGKRNSLVIANAVAQTDRAARFFQWLRERPVSVPIFAILPADDGALLQAAAEIVDDFLLSPVHQDELNKRLTRLLGSQAHEPRTLQQSLADEIGMQQLAGKDPAFLRVLNQVSQYAKSDAPLLLTGETGTGKELCARVVHLLSRRQQGPFIPVDCGAIPDHLFENEVFGHVKGAFTDARTDQKGLVSLAQGGTLFMDEIDSLSLMAQSKVLRLLQERSFRPLGSERFNRADVRIVAATNRDLERAVDDLRFRSDLFFRINVLRIRIPPLRERRSDVPLLSRHFIDEICRAEGLPKKVLSLSAQQKLEQYDWPGNVRELCNTVQRAVLNAPGTQIAAPVIDLNREVPEEALSNFRNAKLVAIQAFERNYVRQLMEKNNGNVTRAAREAGKDRRAFGRLAKKYWARAASA
jgi:two-component system response regulator GlrR